MTNTTLTNAVQPFVCGTRAPMHDWRFDVGNATFGLLQHSDFGLTYFGRPECSIHLGWWYFTVPMSAPVTLLVCLGAVAVVAVLTVMLRRHRGGANAA
jgi:hypothetical protein